MGVAPKPLPPVYDPELVADAILHAATHRVRELTVGGAGAGLGTLEKLSPRLLDLQLTLTGYQTQQADEPQRSEEHTSELQSRQYLVCRLLLENKTHPYSPRLRAAAFTRRLHPIFQYPLCSSTPPLTTITITSRSRTYHAAAHALSRDTSLTTI